jgi:hypothetical protein
MKVRAGRRNGPAQPGASTSEVARRYGINRRILCLFKNPVFVQFPEPPPMSLARTLNKGLTDCEVG